MRFVRSGVRDHIVKPNIDPGTPLWR